MRTFRWIMALVLARIPRSTWLLNPLASELSNQEGRSAVEKRLEVWDAAVEEGIGMVFFGPNGTGKTTLACEMGKFALAQGESVGYLTANELVAASQPNSTTGWILQWLEEVQVVILDELDKPYAKGGSTFVPSVMDSFLRTALINGKVLIGASNYSVDDLVERYGNSFVSALERSCTYVGVDGDDLSAYVQQQSDDRLASGMDFGDPVFQKWAKLYHASTYTEIKETL